MHHQQHPTAAIVAALVTFALAGLIAPAPPAAADPNEFTRGDWLAGDWTVTEHGYDLTLGHVDNLLGDGQGLVTDNVDDDGTIQAATELPSLMMGWSTGSVTVDVAVEEGGAYEAYMNILPGQGWFTGADRGSNEWPGPDGEFHPDLFTFWEPAAGEHLTVTWDACGLGGEADLLSGSGMFTPTRRAEATIENTRDTDTQLGWFRTDLLVVRMVFDVDRACSEAHVTFAHNLRYVFEYKENLPPSDPADVDEKQVEARSWYSVPGQNGMDEDVDPERRTLNIQYIPVIPVKAILFLLDQVTAAALQPVTQLAPADTLVLRLLEDAAGELHVFVFEKAATGAVSGFVETLTPSYERTVTGTQSNLVLV